MNKTIDFYFDFSSPYAFLGHHALPPIAAQHGYHINYRPLDIVPLKLAVGNTGPSTRDIPAKLAYAQQDFVRWSKHYGIAMASAPSVFKHRDLNLGTLYANTQGKAAQYVELVFARVWGQPGVKDDADAILRDVAAQLGMDITALTAFIANKDAAQAYQQEFDAAVTRGVFGVPTMIVDEQIWWGNDRLFMLEEYLLQQPVAHAAAA